jgi:hypothetical protein
LRNQAECLLDPGYPAEAVPRIEESVAIARRLSSPTLDGRLALLERTRRALSTEE